jgi:hypothetical protein
MTHVITLPPPSPVHIVGDDIGLVHNLGLQDLLHYVLKINEYSEDPIHFKCLDPPPA